MDNINYKPNIVQLKHDSGSGTITLLGTKHYSTRSKKEVHEFLESTNVDHIYIEVGPYQFQQITAESNKELLWSQLKMWAQNPVIMFRCLTNSAEKTQDIESDEHVTEKTEEISFDMGELKIGTSNKQDLENEVSEFEDAINWGMEHNIPVSPADMNRLKILNYVLTADKEFTKEDKNKLERMKKEFQEKHTLTPEMIYNQKSILDQPPEKASQVSNIFVNRLFRDLNPKREAKMAENVISATKENPDDHILLICGYSHLAPIKKRIVEELDATET